MLQIIGERKREGEIMRRSVLFIITLVSFGMAVTPAYADLSASAVVTVYATVPPAVAVVSRTPVVSIGNIQVGSFSGDVTFGISANMQRVNFILEASDLYLAGDPVNVFVPPIPLDKSKAIQITPQFGNRVGGQGNQASWDSGTTVMDGFPMSKTVSVAFESPQIGKYSQDVVFRVFYIQSDPIKPLGGYSGKVRLTAFVE